MEALWVDLLKFWKDNGFTSRFRALKIGMWTNADDPHGHMPKLKGKAIEIRNFVPALLHVWVNRMDPSLPEHQAIAEGLKCSAAIDEILDLWADVDVLPKHAVKEFQSACWTYAQCQNAAADHYNRVLGFLVFDVTIKTHWTLHCAIESAFLNPRYSWNYSGEDFMMKCRELLASCCKGNTASSSVNKFAGKYWYALEHMFKLLDHGMQV